MVIGIEATDTSLYAPQEVISNQKHKEEKYYYLSKVMEHINTQTNIKSINSHSTISHPSETETVAFVREEEGKGQFHSISILNFF